VSQRRAVSGFTLVTVIFLLVVVSGLVVYITNIGVVQQTTVVYGLQGARALQAARSGIEWGIFQSINNGVCAGSTTINDAPLQVLVSRFNASRRRISKAIR
jgi:MSHA biogenesis protein MshP